MEIAGRVAVVTGAAVGTGRAIALALAEAGAEVVAADVDEDGGRRTASDAGGRFVRADMTVAEDVRRLMATSEPAILVNNAGGGGHIPPHFPEATPEQWGATLDLNLRGPMLATQLALVPMRAAGGGAVVNVASTAGLGDEPYASPEYGAAKAGLVRFTSALGALELVRVNCLIPDWVATERVTPEERASTPALVPLAAVADGVLRLVRDDSLAGRSLLLLRGQPPRLL